MSIYHCSIKIISRSGGRSAIASAAYRAGERLKNYETGITHDFTNKGGVIMNEIILPESAPKEYAEREVLWNEVQKIEKRSDAQLAREVEVALPKEMTREEQIECVRDYIKENFVSRGMIADWALHDKNDGNPHAHIMLTLRGVEKDGQWSQKLRTVFANYRDEEGRASYDPYLPAYDPKDKDNTSPYRIPVLDKNGKQKTRVRKGKGTEYLWERVNVPANNWNDHSQAEIWRASWAEHCNKYLDKNNQIDHRSYERQGIEIEPTIHEGVTARQMETKGKTADRCQINRDIAESNSVKGMIRRITAELSNIIMEKARKLNDVFRKIGDDREENEFTREYDVANRELAGAAVGAVGSDEDITVTNIDAFLGKLEAKECSSEEKRDDSITERKDREAQRERYNIEAERRAEEERVRNKKKCRDRDFSL
ncbi:MAG: MobA/MobL family protein [Lachnospiraceae bacterium]|nr:MobA/MobL family protein [Lachnospiraceae bacterium]